MKTRKRFMRGCSSYVRFRWLADRLARELLGRRSLVLEMRIFTKESLEQELRDAGFSSIEFDRRECAEFGIVFRISGTIQSWPARSGNLIGGYERLREIYSALAARHAEDRSGGNGGHCRADRGRTNERSGKA